MRLTRTQIDKYKEYGNDSARKMIGIGLIPVTAVSIDMMGFLDFRSACFSEPYDAYVWAEGLMQTWESQERSYIIECPTKTWVQRIGC